MFSVRQITLLVILSWFSTIICGYGMNVQTAKKNPRVGKAAVPFGNQAGLISIFSPRMDFEQWKPLTGRGDPLRNDPTYDYDPPVLDRVHYWADDTEREQHTERKSEVLMLGVSSKKPSITPRPQPLPPNASSRQPSLPSRRQHTRLPPPKYEDFTYKLSDQYPLTILVPPPPPPPPTQRQQPPLFVYSKEKSVSPFPIPKLNNHPKVLQNYSTAAPQTYSNSFALQKSNLIYQSSTTSKKWANLLNETKPPLTNEIISDYAGWGPTTPIDPYEIANATHNLISNNHVEFSDETYSLLKPLLSESNLSSQESYNSISLNIFVPTALPSTTVTKTDFSTPTPTVTITTDQMNATTEQSSHVKETTSYEGPIFVTDSTETPPAITNGPESDTTLVDMLGPMMSMPLVNGPDRPEDNLYAYASQNKHVFQLPKIDDIEKLKNMQTMQPPPPTKSIEATTQTQSVYIHTHDPYLHMRFTTPPTITESVENKSKKIKSPIEIPNIPMYLIIQGHSKVKTYGSTPMKLEDKDTESNEVSKGKETDEVRHLHPLKEKLVVKHAEMSSNRASKAHNLKTLVDNGLGSIEIQEADIGIKYDVSDGSYVPLELYKKGVVYSEDNDYSSSSKTNQTKRTKRQLDLEDFLPFDEDTLEEYVYNFLEGKQNDTGIAGLIAKAVTSETASMVDDLEDEKR